MAPSQPPPKEESPPSPPSTSTSKVTSSSLLHLLADASSELPSRIGSSYHLSPNPPPGLTSPAPGLVSDGSGGKKRKAEQDGSEGAGGKKDKGKQPAAGKAVLSCQECRRLKLKCDRVFPCSNCKKRGVATICPDGELKGGKGKRLILASTVELHARISTLEQALHDAHCSATGSTAPHPLLASSFHFEPLDVIDSVPTPSASGPSSGPSLPREPIDATAVDIAQRSNYGSLTMSEEPGVTRFFGPAGSQYFLAEDSSPPSSSSGQPTSRPSPHDPYANAFSSSSNLDDLHFGLHQTPSGLTDSFPFEGAPASTQVSLEVLRSYLPSRELAWSLAETYYRNASWMHEDIVPRSSFYQHFFPHFYPNEPSSQPPNINNHRLAVLYMILSLGSLFDLNVPAQNKTSRKYYSLARASLAWNTTASVAFIQAIHLMVTMLMHAEKATTGGEASWPLLRLAVAASQSIGLHRDGANWNLRPEEVEERRRVFWEINSYDISQSIALGRPRAMASATIDTQFPGSGTDDSLLRTASQQKYLFCNILTQINDLQTSAVIGTFHQVLKIDREIRAFEKNLPTQLHCTEDSCVLPEDGEDWDAKKLILQRYGNLLMINAALLFTHRGCFARALRDHPDEPLKSKFSQSYVAELEASKVLISVLRDVLKLQLPLVSRFWIFFFHSFSAAASLAVAVIRAPKSSLAKAAFEEVELAVSLFETAKVGSRARDELPTLQRLRDRAREQLLSSRGPSRKLATSTSAGQPSADDPIDLLGAETTLHRTRAPPASTTTPSSSHLSPPASTSATPSSSTSAPSPDPFRLPTTLEEAVAQSMPAVVDEGGGGSFDGFPQWMQDPMPYGDGSLENVGLFGFGGQQPQGMLAGGGGQDAEFDFDEFIAGLGVSMNDP